MKTEKKAKTIEEQIDILISRGLIINDVEKSKEMLLDIGYYRLGFYSFPFEVDSESNSRRHFIRVGTTFDDIKDLYYFDFDLRNLLIRYLSRIEVSFRTFITYYMSINNKDDQWWFVNPKIVSHSFIRDFPNKVYQTPSFRDNTQIRHHHIKYRQDMYAPAWKTLEFMTFGSIVKLYKSFENRENKVVISKHFGVNKLSVFESYISAILTLRNKCAHGSALFDLSLPNGILSKGPKLNLVGNEHQKLIGAIEVLKYILRQISVNRYNELNSALFDLYNKNSTKSESFKQVLKCYSGLNI